MQSQAHCFLPFVQKKHILVDTLEELARNKNMEARKQGMVHLGTFLDLWDEVFDGLCFCCHLTGVEAMVGMVPLP